MRERRLKKTLAFIVMIAMVFTMAYTPLGAAYAATESTWTALDDIDAAAESEKPVAITMTKSGGATYALPAATTSSSPAAKAAEIQDGKLVISGAENTLGWTVTKTGDGDSATYTFQNSEGSYLYLTASNTGIRVGNKPTTGGDWKITDEYLSAVDSNDKTRYIGVYTANGATVAQDWRCYTLTNTGAFPSNISDQTLQFWKFEGEQQGEETQLVPISQALAASSGEFKVKGVVTMVDEKNIYIQDETGGICLYFDAAPSGIELGDTIIGTGTRAAYNGLPELTGAAFEESEGMTLSAKDTTIGALVISDICTYVKLTDLTVTEVYDNNGAFTNPNITVKDAAGNSIQLYKAVIGKTDGVWDVAVDDVIDITGTVSINKTTLQLRNTVASEIIVKSEPQPEGPFTVTIEASENGTVTASKTEDIAAGEEITLTVTPAEGYKLDKLLVNDEETAVGEDGTATVAITKDTTVSATFKEDVPEPETVPISDALAGATGDEFTVKGVVTLVDGRNIYIQDDTGAICLYLKATSDIKLGDTVIGTGSRTTYRGLPELQNATYQKSSGLTLTAKETTIGALTDADLCTYISIKDLEVTEINGDNTIVKDSNGDSLPIYKAVVKDSLEVGDKIDFKGALGIYTNKQLRNTVASEITVKGEEGLVTDLADLKNGSYVTIYNPGSNLAMSSDTYRDWYLLGGAPTIEDNKIVEPDAKQVWKVTVNSDGTYTFTQEGNRAVAGWLSTSGSSTFVELTSNALQEGADTAWVLSPANEENHTFYMKSNTLSAGHGSFYIEVYNKNVDGVQTPVFCGYDTSEDKLTEGPYGMQFYVVPEPDTPDPGEVGDLITSLDELTDGQTIAIYSPSHKTAISTKPNGDWYLKANNATVEDGVLKNFTDDFVWKVKINEDGTYAFYSYSDETSCISVWPSGTYAELTVNPEYNSETVHDWELSPFDTNNYTWYIKSSTLKIERDSGGQTQPLPVYIEAYVRNGTEVYSGYAPFTNQLSSTDYALQFIKVDPEDAVDSYDDGEWDGVLTPGDEYVIYNTDNELSLGLYKAANYAFDAIPTIIDDDNAAVPGNGAYAFKVDSMGRYYTFEVNGQYLCTNNDEELFFIGPDEDGKIPDTAKWYLKPTSGETEDGNEVSGYLIYNKEAQYGGTPVTIEYFSSVFSGWTFNTRNDLGIYVFNFHKVAEGTQIHDGVVQVPSAEFDCENYRYVEQDFPVTISLDDLCPDIEKAEITYTVEYAESTKTEAITDYETSSDGKNYTFTIPAADIDGDTPPGSFEIKIAVTNGYGISYESSRLVGVIDLPFFEDLTPPPASQTGDDLKPVISARVRNAGTDPTVTMTINDEEITSFTFEDGVISYKPDEDLTKGKTTVQVSAKRTDGKAANDTWSFTAGKAEYELYFGQLHSHTTYSDGSGTLETALDYISSLPESANVQFVAFTDHSNYFDTTSAANPAGALNDKELMTPASKALWEGYKDKVAAFNAKQKDVVAIAGFEMTWSGGPGHINTFDSDGLVSRNNAELNNKTNDAGMKLYYETINKGDSMNQFNHPGATFGNFTDFSYWDEETDDHMFLVEVGNGEGLIGAGGYYPSYEQYIMALDKGWHVAPTNNQDNHKGRWGNANDARDVVLTNDFSEEGIYNAIRAMRIYATEDKNLQITYTVNGKQMGTIFEEAPEKLNIDITNYDPDNNDPTDKVELVANGGKVVKTWDSSSDPDAISKGTFTAEIDPDDSYYFVRITQADNDIAVTAPVWVGKGISAGISDVVAPESAIVDTDTTLTTSFFNNEESAATVKSITYTADGSKVIGTDNEAHEVPAGGTIEVPFTFKPDTAKRMTITVTAVMDVGGSEMTYTKDVILSVRNNEGPLPVTPISKVQAQTEEGFEYAIEGVVTSNASGYDKDTAFFDCVYVQDGTAGICCFPVSGDYKIGDKVHIEGYTDFYQGEAELQVQTIKVIGEGSIEPTEVTAKQINDLSVLGSLVTIKGTIESFEEANGLIQTIMVKDADGDVARVFIDGYITTENEVAGCEVGAEISATGLASYDDTFNAPDGPFPRIRIRDRADIVCGAVPSDPAEVEEAIEELPIPSEITIEDEAAIENAQAMYDGLSEADKKVFPKALQYKLEAAGAKLTAIKAQAAADAAEADKDKAEAAAAAAEAAQKAAEEIAKGSAADADRAKAALALASGVVDAVGVETGKYKASTVEKLNEALNAAKAVLKNPNATTAEMNAASAKLSEAAGGLVLKNKNPMTVKAKTAKVKVSKLRKKTQKIARKKALTVKNAKGKVTYKKVKGNKKITINKTTGKISVKKGLKKGTYKIKVKVSAFGDGDHEALTLTRVFKVKVK